MLWKNCRVKVVHWRSAAVLTNRVENLADDVKRTDQVRTVVADEEADFCADFCRQHVAADERANHAVSRPRILTNRLNLELRGHVRPFQRDWPADQSDGQCRTPHDPVSYTHLRAHETRHDLVCRLLLENKKHE